jgi:chromosome segregation protein
MRLQSITLHGFKSFAERTEVKVLPGITAIVGPNGAGKSNLSDAVRWALGEQSARQLRGQKMDDVIFHGSQSRKPVGLAEVELCFSNEDGALAVPWSEIAVARRLYRTGESDYLLNGQPTRLRDILDLFAGTGANPRAYSVMDQERLNHVLTAKPHERRIFIEEAAGIARYKQQRHETQGKLDAARQNLVRVRDVMDEVRRQLGSLERQARRAQQYKALAEERRQAALAVAAADHAALVAELRRLDAELTARRDRQAALRAEAGRLAGRQAAQRQRIQESDHRLTDVRQALQKVQAELERLLERREQMGVQVREAEAELVRIEEEIRTTHERLEALARDREATRLALAEAERQRHARREAAAELETRLVRRRDGLAAERDRLEALRLEQARAAGERTDLMRSAGELRERESQLARRTERLAEELRQAEAESERLVVARAALESRRAEALAALTSLAAERSRLAEALARTEQALAAAESEAAEHRLALAARRSSLDALEGLERAREGYGAGVRALLGDGRSRIDGLVGTVADLLEVPPDLERAVEAVLGERLQWVVVERFDQARTAVGWLQANRAGSATFLPLETLAGPHPTGNGAAAGPGDEDGSLEWLARRVSAASPGLVAALLGRVALVEHLDQAEALWRRNGTVATYVTPAGEVLATGGRLRGGAGSEPEAAASSLLARKRQIRELEQEVRRLAALADEAGGRAAALAADAAALRAQLPRVEGEMQAGEAERLAGEKDLEQVRREHERVHRHLETVRLEIEQVSREAADAAALLAGLEQRIAAAREAEAGHERAMAALREAIETAQAEEAALVAELTACRVDAASINERVEALGRELARLEEMERDLRERREQAGARRTQLADRRVWLEQERARTDEAAREVAAERDRGEEEARRAGEAHQALLDELTHVEQDLARVEADLRRLGGEIHELELQTTERRVRRDELALEVQRTHGVSADELAARHDPTLDAGALRRRIDELDERLAAIGPVNLVADEEYRELDERLTFLRTQHDDLTASIKDLEKALRGMTRTAQERFLQAFEQINRDFARLFERLFEGGRAELRLVPVEEGGDPLDTGVELMAQPRGKRLQAVTLLSGGERALAGLALLFAIFYFRPSPFCILDEVDAPLDDANIHRFLRVLRELTDRTQFLVMTHNRRTMEAADVLYGVTMEEPGLSKLVSVKLES